MGHETFTLSLITCVQIVFSYKISKVKTNVQNKTLDDLGHFFIRKYQFSEMKFSTQKIAAISAWSISTQKCRIYIHYHAVLCRKSYIDKNIIQFHEVSIKKVYNFLDSHVPASHTLTHHNDTFVLLIWRGDYKKKVNITIGVGNHHCTFLLNDTRELDKIRQNNLDG